MLSWSSRTVGDKRFSVLGYVIWSTYVCWFLLFAPHCLALMPCEICWGGRLGVAPSSPLLRISSLPSYVFMKVLIKEACDRAIEAEILAKAHLGELNKDLSVHCRIPVCIFFIDPPFQMLSLILKGRCTQTSFLFLFIKYRTCYSPRYLLLTAINTGKYRTHQVALKVLTEPMCW